MSKRNAKPAQARKPIGQLFDWIFGSDEDKPSNTDRPPRQDDEEDY